VFDEPSRAAVDEHTVWLGLRGIAATTIYVRRRILARLADHLLAGLLDATEADLYAWRAGLRVAPDTATHYISNMRAFYAWCHVTGRLPANPAARVPSPKVSRRLPRPIAEDDLADAFLTAPERVRPWLVLAACCGLRACEIAYLRRENVLDQLPQPAIHVVREATKGHRERVVPMSPFVLSELRRAGLPRRGWCFCRHDNNPGPNAPHTVSQLANRHLHGIGIAATLHELRHRYGSICYQTTLDLRKVQERMGHADPATTAGYAAYVPQVVPGELASLDIAPTLRVAR
jgi:integrase/recombinase XerC